MTQFDYTTGCGNDVSVWPVLCGLGRERSEANAETIEDIAQWAAGALDLGLADEEIAEDLAERHADLLDSVQAERITRGSRIGLILHCRARAEVPALTAPARNA